MSLAIPRRDRRAALLIAGVGVLYAIPVLLTGRPNIDDLGRSLGGYSGWIPNGRALSDVLMVLLNSGYPLSDLSPLTQLGAVALMCWCCFLLFRWTAGLDVAGLPRAAACTLFLLNPFFLQNIAYKFDSLPMALAVLCAVVAVRPRDDRWWVAALRTAGWVLLALNLYQAAVNATLALAVVLVVVEADRGEPPIEILRRLGARLGGFAGANILYALTIGRFLTGGDYTSKHSGSVPLSLEGLEKLRENIARSTGVIWTSFDGYQQALLSLPALLAAIYCLVLATRIVRSPRPTRAAWVLAVVLVVAPVAVFLTSFGISAALRRPVFDPRVFIGFGVFLVWSVLFGLRVLEALKGGGWRRVLRRVALFFVLVQPLVIGIAVSSAFGVAQSAQRRYDSNFAMQLQQGLLTLNLSNPKLAIDGTQPFAPAARRETVRFPILNRLVPLYLRNGWWWGSRMLAYDGVRVVSAGREEDPAVSAAQTMLPDYSGSGFTLTKVGDTVVLRFD